MRSAHWRAGCGTALVQTVVESARERGFRQLTLWVLATNDAALRFYEVLGFAPDGCSKTDSRFGVTLHDVRYGRRLVAQE